jgi:site-specific DNA-cytosine methylase
MKYLSLFSGGAGGDLAMQHLLGFRCVGMVEYDDYCQKLLMQRQADGLLDQCPIFGDIREFIKGGYAEAFAGVADVITAGFP